MFVSSHAVQSPSLTYYLYASSAAELARLLPRPPNPQINMPRLGVLCADFEFRGTRSWVTALDLEPAAPEPEAAAAAAVPGEFSDSSSLSLSSSAASDLPSRSSSARSSVPSSVPSSTGGPLRASDSPAGRERVESDGML